MARSTKTRSVSGASARSRSAPSRPAPESNGGSVIPYGSNFPDNAAMALLAGDRPRNARELFDGLRQSCIRIDEGLEITQKGELEATLLAAEIVRYTRKNRAAVLDELNLPEDKLSRLRKNPGIPVAVADVLYGRQFARLDERQPSSKSRIKANAEFLSGYYQDDEEAYFGAISTLNTMADLQRLRREAGGVPSRRQRSRDAAMRRLEKALIEQGVLPEHHGSEPRSGDVAIALVSPDAEGNIATYCLLHPDQFGDGAKGYFRLLRTVPKRGLLARGVDEAEVDRLSKGTAKRRART